MRVLLVHNNYQQSGGEDKVMDQEVMLLRNNGHEVIEYRRSNVELLKIGKFQRLKIPKRIIWAKDSINDLRELIRQKKPDLVHFHNTFMLVSPSAYYAVQEAGVPVIQTLHNYRLFCPNALFFRSNRICEDCLGKFLPWPGVIHACYRNSRSLSSIVVAMIVFHRWRKTWQKQVDLYIALSEFSRKKFIEGGLPAEKILIKPNFIHPDPGPRSEKMAGEYALFVGRLSSEKGLTILLAAWKSLNGILLKIVGEGPLRNNADHSIKKYGLKNVEVLGHRPNDEVIKLIKKAVFLVVPSVWHETFGLVAVESFACGVPVIAARLGAMNDIVEDGKTGLLFTSGDHKDLAAKVHWAWTHPKKIVAMGKEARLEYEQKYTAKQNYKILMGIYNKAISEHRHNVR